jgi:hypothetical protein
MKKIYFSLIGLFLFLNANGIDYKYSFLLTGASFGVPENGWFELSCKAFEAEAINKAVSGEAIFHTANRMATNTFYTKAELERTDVFVIMHVHNQNVANTTWLKDNYLDYTMPTSNYEVAYDYVIKKYKDDCYKLKDDPTSKYYGTQNGKPAVIILCTHWHDSRTTYNSAIRILAQKWNLPIVEWDTFIGFTKNVLENGQQPSLQYAKDTEVINGVTYAWHPLRGQEQYIQKKISEVFNAAMEQIVGVIPVSATVSASSTAILLGETAKVNVTFTGLAPWSFAYKVNGQVQSLTNLTDNPLKLSFSIPPGESLEVEPISVSNNSNTTGIVSGLASVTIADKIINPVYDAYVHQANKTTTYTTDQFVQVKTTADNYSREAFFTFNLSNISDAEEKIIFRAYFYQNVYPANAALVENHMVEITGNTDTYSSMTWNTKPTNMTKIDEILIAPSDLGSYISWDITDWVKTQLNAGKEVATLGLKVVNNGSGLLYFYSEESAINKPQLIVESSATTGIIQKMVDVMKVYQSNQDLVVLTKEAIQTMSIYDVNGSCIYKNSNFADYQIVTDISQFPVGFYFLNATIRNKAVNHKFVKR